MKKTPSEKVEKWLKLNKEGHFQEAKDFYFESLFAAIIEYFKERTAGRFKKGGVLFSILGYTPEPIILTQQALGNMSLVTGNMEEVKAFLNSGAGAPERESLFGWKVMMF